MLSRLGVATVAILLAVAALAPAGVAHADTGNTAAVRAQALHRDATFYRGRSRSPTAEEGVAWVPRVLLSPFYLVTEYVLREPLIALIGWAERNHVIPWLDRVFHPVPDISWYPTLSLEAGLYVMPGITATWRNLGATGHSLRVAGAFGDENFWSMSARDEWTTGPLRFGVRGGYRTRPNGPFFGLGPASPNVRTNVMETRGEALAYVGLAWESYLTVDVSAGWAHEVTGPGMAPSVDAGPENAAIGLGDFELGVVTVDVQTDTRRDREENGGLRVGGGARFGADPRSTATRFVVVHADVEAAAEISHPDRVLAVRLHVADTVPLSDQPIPFLELPTLGRADHMGFILGRFRGEAALLAEIRYRYPIAYFVDFQWVASVGNVFARDFSDFSLGALTGSLGVGVRTRHTGSDPLEAIVAIGTTRFDQSFSVQSIGVFVGTKEDL